MFPSIFSAVLVLGVGQSGAGDIQKGKVIDVQDLHVSVLFGTNFGGKLGEPVILFRTNPPTYLGEAKLVEVNAEKAVARIIGKTRDRVTKGDRVAWRSGQRLSVQMDIEHLRPLPGGAIIDLTQKKDPPVKSR